jgi:hypothetical protein
MNTSLPSRGGGGVEAGGAIGFPHPVPLPVGEGTHERAAAAGCSASVELVRKEEKMGWT